MTKVTFFKRNGVFYGFHETGHTGYAEAGDDILCSALSAMTMLIINAIEISYASNVDYVIDEDTADITVTALDAIPGHCPDEKKQYAVAGIIQAYYYQLNDLVEEYYDYLSVDESQTDE